MKTVCQGQLWRYVGAVGGDKVPDGYGDRHRVLATLCGDVAETEECTATDGVVTCSTGQTANMWLGHPQDFRKQFQPL